MGDTSLLKRLYYVFRIDAIVLDDAGTAILTLSTVLGRY